MKKKNPTKADRAATTTTPGNFQQDEAGAVPQDQEAVGAIVSADGRSSECRIVGVADAIKEFLRPLSVFLDGETGDEDFSEIGGRLWNYARAYAHGVFDLEEEERIVDSFVEHMNLAHNQPLLLFYRMLSRFEAMFPEQIQAEAPEGHLAMLDVPSDFPYSCSLTLDDLPKREAPPYTRDRAFFELFEQYQEMVVDPGCSGIEDEVSDKLHALFTEVFDRWLALKGIEKERELLTCCAGDYFDYLLEQLLVEAADLEYESGPIAHAFLVQWLPTQEGVGPNALSFYLTAIEYVYQFFLEKSYLESSAEVLDVTTLLRDTSLAMRNELLGGGLIGGIKHHLH